MQVDTLMKELLFTTVRIEAELPAGTSTGTGFIYNASPADIAVPVLVTNKHVIAGATRLRILLISAKDDAPDLGTSVTIEYAEPLELWFGHPDPKIDVAAMFLGPMLNRVQQQTGRTAFFRMGSQAQYPTDEVVAALDVVEDILFVGYPNGLIDSHNHTPIVRRGSTATPIQLDWSGTPTFLIDASVFPGSSGSPVFLLQEGIVRSGNELVLGGASRLLLLGIVAAVMRQPTDGRIVFGEAVPQVSVNQMIDLGIVYNWRAIEQTVDALCAARNIDRSIDLSSQAAKFPDLPADVRESPR